MPCAAILLPLALALSPPQNPPDAQPVAPVAAFPDRPETMVHAPFLDPSGQPLAAPVRAFFTLDLDGNRIPDACWLGEPAPGPGLSFAMGREHSPGRFRAWPVAAALPGAFTGGCALRQAWLDQDTALFVDPAQPYPIRAGFDLAFTNNPHGNGWFTSSPFYCLPPLYGAREIAALNREGDGCDDVAVLYDRGPLGCTIAKYRLDAPLGVPLLLGATHADLPLPFARLRLLDFDGDGRSDVAAELPGYGVLVGRDDGGPALQFLAWLPSGPLNDLTAARFGASDALVMATGSGVLVCWLDPQGLGWHWLPAEPGAPVGSAALLPGAGLEADLAALAADGRTLQSQRLLRGGTPAPADVAVPADPALWMGAFAPCALHAADLDGDGDADLVVQHPDGASWCSVRNERQAVRPELVSLVQNLSLVTLGWYGGTFTIGVPPAWDLATFPQIELQVMVEHPFTAQQLRWDRRVALLDPLTRSATFTVQWQDSAATTAAFLQNPYLVPSAFAQAGWLSAGRRTQLNFLGLGVGNSNFAGAERRSEPLLYFTDPGGSGNKSAQGVVWEKRAAPPLPRADAALLPWQ